MDKKKKHVFILTYGMAFIFVIINTVGFYFEKYIADSILTLDQEIIKHVLLLSAMTFLEVGAINILRFREIPRLRHPSITGQGAIFWGLILLIPITLFEIHSIIEVIKLLSPLLIK